MYILSQASIGHPLLPMMPLEQKISAGALLARLLSSQATCRGWGYGHQYQVVSADSAEAIDDSGACCLKTGLSLHKVA